MLGTKALEAVLGTGIDNRDHDAVKATLRQMADLGLSVLFIYPNSKEPADLRTTRQRSADDKAAQTAAREAGRRDWAAVKSPAGLALATSDRATLERYLKRYIQLFSTWVTVPENDEDYIEVTWSKKAEDVAEITIAEPAAVNLAIEVGGSGVVVIDCDTAAQMRRWFEVAEVDPSEAPAPTIITPGQVGTSGDPNDPSTWSHSDGGHFWFTVPDRYMPVLPRHLGAMTWGGDNGFAVLWDRRYVLVPPSTRPEGAYEMLGHVYELPDWLAEEIIKAGERRVQRAALAGGARTDRPELADAVDTWAQQVSWASILEPMGWTPHPRADSCGCAVWTAPGDHASPKSATAHDTGCTAGRYSEVNAPLYIWTDHDTAPFDAWVTEHGQTISKLQAVAVINYAGSVGAAMDELGITPDLSVDPDIEPRQVDPDHGITGDGDFELPAGPSGTISTTEGQTVRVTDGEIDPAPVPYDPSANIRCWCGILVHPDMPNVMPDDDGELWHLPLDADNEDAAHVVNPGGAQRDKHAAPGENASSHDAELMADSAMADVTSTTTYAADLSDLPADFGKKPKADSPYPDQVDDPDPDVFDSPHPGVPRIAPFSHWRDMPPPEYIIDGLLEHGGLGCIIGAPNIGKSTVALDMACHIATGKSWQGRQTLKTRVLYLPGEGLSGAIQRILAWEHAHDLDLSDLILGNGIILVKAQNEAWGDIAGYIARQGIGLVIFDTFARMSSGLEENSATDVGTAVRRFDKLKELTNAGVLVVHHTAKGSPETGRGSSALNGALDSELLVRPATWDTSQISGDDHRLDGKPIEVLTSKQKNAEQLEYPIPLLVTSYQRPGAERSTALITGPNGDVDPMEGDVILARPPEPPVVETAIRIRQLVDGLPEQGASKTEIALAVRPDAYARSRADTAAYWKQRITEAVDRGLRYRLIETLTGTPSGARYIPSTTTPDEARARAAAEVSDSE